MRDDELGHDGLPWWHVHFPTLLGSLVMTGVTIVVGLDAARSGHVGTWLATLFLAVNAGALLAAARVRALGNHFEGAPRKFARVSELGHHGRLEWWWSVVAFVAFLGAIAATILG